MGNHVKHKIFKHLKEFFTYLIILVPLLILLYWFCFIYLNFEDISAKVAIFVGLFSIITSLFINYYTTNKQIKFAKYTIDRKERLNALTDLHIDFNSGYFNDEIKKFIRIVEFETASKKIFYVLFHKQYKQYKEIEEKYHEGIGENWSIIRHPNPNQYAYLFLRYFFITLYIGEEITPSNTTLMNPIYLFEEGYCEYDYMINFYEESILDYINELPADPNGTFYTRDKVLKIYSLFLKDVTDFNKEFERELDNLWGEFINHD